MIAFYAEGAVFKLHLVAGVEAAHQVEQQLVALYGGAGGEVDDVAAEIVGVADAVYARNRRNHNHVAPPRKQGGGSAQAQLFYLFIYRQVFFDVGIRYRDESFRLIIVVIGNKIFDGIIGEKLFEFAIELRCQRFVVA